MRIRLRGRDGRPHCPLCRVIFVGEPELYTCPGCETGYHADCASELGGCSTLGCRRLGVGPGADEPEDQRLRARARRFREARRARRAAAPRLRQEHVAEAQSLSVTEGLEAGAFVVEAGCMAFQCLSAAVVLVTLGLALLIAR